MVKNKVLYYLAINVNRDYIGLTITALVYRTIVGRVGTTSGCSMSHLLSRTSSCYEPELIPDPVCWKWRWLSQPVTIACHKMLDLGSGVVS